MLKLKLKTKFILAGTYILTFILALVITCFIQNWGIRGSDSSSGQTLPVIYVSCEDSMINKMDAYITPIDCGYLRETVSVLGADGSLLLDVFGNDCLVESLNYSVSDAANEYVVEEGTADLSQSSGTGLRYVVRVDNPLVEGREYCLTLTMTDTEGEQYYFYTRIVSGNDHKLSDKLSFVWEFNQNTMNPEKSSSVEPYLQTSGLNDNTTFTNVDIYSSTFMVMWGNSSPSVSGRIATNIKAISAQAATIQLLYKVQVYEDASSYKEYYVNEYYTVQMDDSTWRLRDFHRALSEIPDSNSFEITSNQLRLGVVSESSLGLVSAETDQGYAAVFTMDGSLWYYDVSNNIMTRVIAPDPSENASGRYPFGIKALDIEENGTLHFIVYGYMPSGDHGGETGIGVYTYDPDQNTAQEQAFIPSDRGYEMLMMDVEKLAFMNDDHELYLCLNDIVYRIDAQTGQAREVIEQLDINNYKLSADGTVLAMPNDPQAANADQILVYYLDTGEEKTISADGKVVRLLGFFGNDLVYGTADPSMVYEDSVGSQIVPMDTLYIVDRDLNVVREYAADGKYITGVQMGESTINIALATASEQNGTTVFTNAQGDYLVYNETEEEQDIYLTNVHDSVMGNEVYIQLPSSLASQALSREGVVRTGGEAVFEIEASTETAEKYYLYTGDGLYRDYTDLVEAILACTQPTGIVVSESKEIVWEKSVISSQHRTTFETIEQGDPVTSIVRAICAYAENNSQVTVDPSMSLSQALSANLTQHQVVSLRGLSLDDVLYFVYSDRLVGVQRQEGDFVIIVGYDPYYLQVADPSAGTVSDWNYEYFTDAFQEEGNIFLSYY